MYVEQNYSVLGKSLFKEHELSLMFKIYRNRIALREVSKNNKLFRESERASIFLEKFPDIWPKGNEANIQSLHFSNVLFVSRENMYTKLMCMRSENLILEFYIFFL